MTATAEEMEAVQVTPGFQGYCGREMIDYKVCSWKNPYPITWFSCSHENHAVLNCLSDDYKIRMKEFERERRLRIRQKKIDAAAAEEAMDE